MPRLAFEIPLPPTFVDQRDERNGCFADLCSDGREVVQGLLGNRVEDLIGPEDVQACGFVGGEARRLHMYGVGLAGH